MIEINRNPSRQQLRLFAALWFPAFWLVIGLILLRRFEAHEVVYGIWGAAALTAVVGWLSPPFMRRVYVGMILATYPIGWVVSNLVLIIVYYLILTPTGLLMRLLGRDPMRRRLAPLASSYWIERRSEGSSVERYFRQY